MFSPAEVELLIITAITFALLIWNRLPVEVVALLLMLVLGFTELVPSDRLFAGFSSPVVMTLLGLFVITRALEHTGVVQALAERLNRLGKGSEERLITVFMLAGAGMSLVMNNVAAGAVLLPAVVRVANISNVRVSRLLIPMSFGTLVGGMATYLTTANIVMSTLLVDRGLEGLNMLDFLPTGEPHTYHTVGPVSLFIIDPTTYYELWTWGRLADVAPTVLDLVGLEAPEEMTGRSLIKARKERVKATAGAGD